MLAARRLESACKLGFDTAENEPRQVCCMIRAHEPGFFGSSLRSEVNSELNFPPDFEGLVLGCIEADFIQ